MFFEDKFEIYSLWTNTKRKIMKTNKSIYLINILLMHWYYLKYIYLHSAFYFFIFYRFFLWLAWSSFFAFFCIIRHLEKYKKQKNSFAATNEKTFIQAKRMKGNFSIFPDFSLSFIIIFLDWNHESAEREKTRLQSKREV